MLYNVLVQVLPLENRVTAAGFINHAPTDLEEAKAARDELESNIASRSHLVLYGDGKAEFISGYRMVGLAEITIPGDVLKQSVINMFIVEAL